MDKKKILIASVSFYPRISPRSFRATELAKELSRRGHDVTVLTNKDGFDYGEFSNVYKVEIKDFVSGKIKESSDNSIVKKTIRFLLNYFFLYPNIRLATLLKNALKDEFGYDLLISLAVPYPVHWGVALAKTKNSNLCKVWAADCGDPFIGNKEQRFRYPFYFKFIENWFCRKPDFITVPVEEAVVAYPSFCREKIRVIPQGFDFDGVMNTPAPKANPYPCFAYAGALSKGLRDPSQFLDYLCTKNDYKFKFIVYTKSISVVENYKNRLGEKLEIRDYIPREQLLVTLSEMDFLVNFENKNNVQSPSKLIDYALIGKPILSIKPNFLNIQSIDEFLNGNYERKLVIEDISQYNIINVANQFITLFNNKEL